MRPREPWRSIVGLRGFRLNGYWEEGIGPSFKYELKRWKWADLHELADVLEITPFMVLKSFLPHGPKAGTILITPLPSPSRWTAGWQITIVRPDMTQPAPEVPFIWRALNLGVRITYPLPYDEDGSPITQATETLEYFLKKRDEMPVMVPRGFAETVLEARSKMSRAQWESHLEKKRD